MSHPHDVHQDAWRWRAHYDSLEPGHETLNEYDEHGCHGFREIDQARLVALELVPQRDGLGAHLLTLPAGSRPIFFRRRALSITMVGDVPVPDLDAETPAPAITCLGWQITVREPSVFPLSGGVNLRNIKSVTFFLEDGRAVVSDDADAVNWGPNMAPAISVPPPALARELPQGAGND